MVRPFLRWMTSAEAQTAAKAMHRIVTDRRTRAHSSNRGSGKAGDQGDCSNAWVVACHRLFRTHSVAEHFLQCTASPTPGGIARAAGKFGASTLSPLAECWSG